MNENDKQAEPVGVTIAPMLYKFLMGEGSIDGCWFGDRHSTFKGAFWWRSMLRHSAEAYTHPAQPVRPYHCPETETLCSKCESHCEAAEPVQPAGAQGEPVAFPGDALRWALNECGVKQTDNGVHFPESALAKLAAILARAYANKVLAQEPESVTFNNDAAWDLAQKVRTDLDRKCCPGPFMDLAMELINKHYTHTAPYVDVNDQILGALKDAATAFDRINHWLEGRGYGGLKPSEIIVLNKLNSAIRAAEAEKAKGGV